MAQSSRQVSSMLSVPRSCESPYTKTVCSRDNPTLSTTTRGSSAERLIKEPSAQRNDVSQSTPEVERTQSSSQSEQMATDSKEFNAAVSSRTGNSRTLHDSMSRPTSLGLIEDESYVSPSQQQPLATALVQLQATKFLEGSVSPAFSQRHELTKDETYSIFERTNFSAIDGAGSDKTERGVDLSVRRDKQGILAYDPRFRRIPFRERQYFRVGRVFAVSEEWKDGENPAQYRDESSTDNLRRMTMRIHRLVVVRVRDAFCLAVPIYTYGGQGLKKPSLSTSSVKAHALIHMSDQEPLWLPDEPRSYKRAMVVHAADSAQVLHPASRICFERTASVGFNEKIIQIGTVADHSVPFLTAYWEKEVLLPSVGQRRQRERRRVGSSKWSGSSDRHRRSKTQTIRPVTLDGNDGHHHEAPGQIFRDLDTVTANRKPNAASITFSMSVLSLTSGRRSNSSGKWSSNSDSLLRTAPRSKNAMLIRPGNVDYHQHATLLFQNQDIRLPLRYLLGFSDLGAEFVSSRYRGLRECELFAANNPAVFREDPVLFGQAAAMAQSYRQRTLARHCFDCFNLLRAYHELAQKAFSNFMHDMVMLDAGDGRSPDVQRAISATFLKSCKDGLQQLKARLRVASSGATARDVYNIDCTNLPVPLLYEEYARRWGVLADPRTD